MNFSNEKIRILVRGWVTIGFMASLTVGNAFSEGQIFTSIPISIDIVLSRCEKDTLDCTPQTPGRIGWVRKCYDLNQKVGRAPLGKLLSSLEKMGMYPLLTTEDEQQYGSPMDSSQPCDPKFTKVVGFCVCSCYTPDQKLSFLDGNRSIYSDFLKFKILNQKSELYTLSKNASMDDLKFTVNPVETYSVSRESVTQPIRLFETETGGTLSVTPNHPIVTAEGIVKEAKHVTINDSFIRFNGERDRVKKITDLNYTGKVYNVLPKSKNILENIVIAQGFLNGSARFQFIKFYNSLIGKKIIRQSINVSSLLEEK